MGFCLIPQTEPEIIEETNIDRVNEPRGYARSRQVKGHSETSTLSSQPSIDEVRQQMHMLLEEAFSLASAGHAGQSRHQEAYGSTQHLPYSEVVTSAPGTMTRPRAGVQWVPTYRPEMYQYSLPRPVSQNPARWLLSGQSCPGCSNRGLRQGEGARLLINHLGIWRLDFAGLSSCPPPMFQAFESSGHMPLCSV